jgi:lipoate-protein ligase B
LDAGNRPKRPPLRDEGIRPSQATSATMKQTPLQTALLLDIPALPYLDALHLMRALLEAKRTAGLPQILMLLEHEPVLTMGRRSSPSEVRVPASCLAEKGIAVHRIERGGLVTYHGPGQLVAYPIFDIQAMGLGVVDLVTRLEEVILMTLADFNITGERKPDYRGVWVGEEKIASIGIAVSHWISFHGLALNYDPDLSHFDLITPCGINGVRMTSMTRKLGEKIDPARLRRIMAGHFADLFRLAFSEWSLEEARRISADPLRPCRMP